MKLKEYIERIIANMTPEVEEIHIYTALDEQLNIIVIRDDVSEVAQVDFDIKKVKA